ncbi:DUF1691-domain-containing protein [Durotheca rogersii]|uniref:DUF1691-domain-containing protein n=1 Tax=Durotheca rogersii TaxID=419775 RepID=UPI002220CA55|nr:DUF1691-domain-containing protein [Durotheca rogersii]KAI5852044.1 DUF1691-domain-containing protein [Durotheca rogersii]
MAYDSRSLHARASQETLISLLHLDPSPIENSSTYDKELPPLPHDGTLPPTSALGLSGSGRGPIYYLSRIQRYSSYSFCLFAGLHLANTSIFPLICQSVPESEQFLLMARELYQTRLAEPLLVALPVVAHVTSGVAVRLLRRRQNLKRYGSETPSMWALHRASLASAFPPPSRNSSNLRIWPPLNYISISGYVFAGLLASHVGLNRILPLVVDGDSSNVGLQYVSHGFARNPVPSWIGFSLLLSVGVGHMVWGCAKWLNVAPPANWKKITVEKKQRKRRRRAWWGVQGVTVAIVCLWASGSLGVVARAGPAEGWLATVYDNIYNAVGH